MTNSRQDYTGFILRLALGSMYLAHGLLKLLVFTPDGTAGFFGSIGLPEFLATPVMYAEIIGGCALILGFYARWVALVLVPVLIGSIFFVHGSNGWGFGNEGGGWEYPAFLIAASLAQFFSGNGAFSIHPTITQTQKA